MQKDYKLLRTNNFMTDLDKGYNAGKDYVSFTRDLTAAEQEREQAGLATLNMPASSEPPSPRTTRFVKRPTKLRMG